MPNSQTDSTLKIGDKVRIRGLIGNTAYEIEDTKEQFYGIEYKVAGSWWRDFHLEKVEDLSGE